MAVVPGSGTDQLDGLEGTLQISISDSKHHYDFEYTLPPSSNWGAESGPPGSLRSRLAGQQARLGSGGRLDAADKLEGSIHGLVGTGRWGEQRGGLVHNAPRPVKPVCPCQGWYAVPVKRHPNGAQLVALVASISINAALWLGLRQVGNVALARGPDDGSLDVVFVIHALPDISPPLPSGQDSAPVPPLRKRDIHSRHPARADRTAQSPAMLTVVGDDRWMQGADEAADRIPTTFERAIGHRVDDGTFDRRPLLDPLPFRDTTLGGVLADLGKREDCKELRAAIRNRRESAATVVATMRRRGCTP